MNTIKIENGMTIITTNMTPNRINNKTGVTGLTFYGEKNWYRAQITYKKKKYSLGCYKEFEEAKRIRKEAEHHCEDGTFYEWYETIPKQRQPKQKS